MSYHRKLHILIIEDEQEPIDTYREILSELRSEFPSVDPTIARSFDDAVQLLRSAHSFHIVVLDLNLPIATRQQPQEGLEPGKQLLEMLAKRDDYPVPVILVVSGRLNLARLSELRDIIEKDFWYGKLSNKGPGLAMDFRCGLQKALEYNDVGIHIRDTNRKWFPILSPCEHDLLRRCILAQTSCLGVDLEWWAAEEGPTHTLGSPKSGPTKVLMGQFLLDDGMGTSRLTFFKFEPVGNAPYTCRDASILNQKLSHVKVCYSASSRSRSILATQSVTNGIPVPLSAYLEEDPEKIQQAIPKIVDKIVKQLASLGHLSEDQLPVHQLLWPSHNREYIAEGLKRSNIVTNDNPNPLALFDVLRKRTDPIWVCRRSCVHGDLNATNIAIDSINDEPPHAFIFDAAGVHADVDLRDLAVLETTTLLFTDGKEVEQHFQLFKEYYDDVLPRTSPASSPTLPALVSNIMCFLTAIRFEVAQTKHPEVYPLMLFDTILIQLGGLSVQPSFNKIVSLARARDLVFWVTTWVTSWLPHVSKELAAAVEIPDILTSPPQ